MSKTRLTYFAAALLVFVVALFSPLGVLARGYLFSAHMLQHILLVLVVPGLLLLSLPTTISLPSWLRNPLVGWAAGVGAMWLWHAPALCNAANTSTFVFTLQTSSLILMGSLFWWQVIAPREDERLSPFAAMGYLFSACIACTVLGIIITFAPVSICPAFQSANRTSRVLGLTTERDQQIGGLLMWVPMCLIYASAILVQVARLHGAPEKHHA